MRIRPTTRRRIRGYLILAGGMAAVAGVALLIAQTYYGEGGEHYAYTADRPSPAAGGPGAMDRQEGALHPAEFESQGGHDPPPGYLAP